MEQETKKEQEAVKEQETGTEQEAVKEQETGKKQKTVKTPSPFKKPVGKKKFQRKYAKYVEHPQDKQFLLSCFELQDNQYTIRNDLTKDDVKKLTGLLKVIKSNKKGAVKLIPIAFAGVITAAVIIFFTIFANPLLEKALEIGLEAAFEARSNVDNLRVSVIPLRIFIGGITVANRDKPMTNLFQVGRTEINLKTGAILRGKVYIERISADTIRFGTARTVSGAIPGKPPREKREKQKNDGPPLVDLKNFDAMALLNQEFDKLMTPKLYDEAISLYNETSAKYKGQVESTTARVQELRNVAQPLINININSIRDVEAIRSTIQNISTAINSVQAATNDVTKIVSGLETDINNARRLESNARNSLTTDINHLKSYIDIESGAAFSAVEPFIREMLSDTAEQYIDYGMIALDSFQKIKTNFIDKPKVEKPKKEKKVVFKGRDVHFPVVSYPAFYLGKLASDFTIDAWNWAFDLQNISSDPDLTYRLENKPAITLDFGAKETSGALRRNVSFNGSADLRTNIRELYNAKIEGSGFPISIENQLSQLGVGGFKGETSFSLKLFGQTDGGFSSGGNVIINKASLVNPSGTIAEAIDSAVKQVGNINMGLQYTHKTNEKDVFNITTNIADLFARALRNAAEAYAKKAIDEIEKVLRQKIDQYIDGRFASKDDVDALFKAVRGDKTAVDQLKTSLNAKKTEFEQKLKTQATSAANQVIKDNLPKLPSLPGLR
jgi:uncharacterized protein (TIGR03545 family)